MTKPKSKTACTTISVTSSVKVSYALARARPDVFNKYPLLLPPPLPHKDPHQLVILLLYRAGREETGDYTRALDTVFQRHPEELAGLADSWALLRPTLPPAPE
ncbi:hypothetical protein [Massilia sp. TWR1-2-2]|uniref:hypothetical protein n=1 Tax=Massilia sp. TWR1-2-2 TaxID=2804584 RepID=UPI003CF1074C